MAANPNALTVLGHSTGQDSRGIVLEKGANELVFAVVGHAGSGTSLIAETLKTLLRRTTIGESQFDAEVLKARDIIADWARGAGLPVSGNTDRPTLEAVKKLQDFGDRMRAEKRYAGSCDHAAIARGLVLRIQRLRASKIGLKVTRGESVKPDGRPRAYILDSLRHPAEAQLLRHIYKDAFFLVGVVCEDEKRIERISNKYTDGGRQGAIEFMRRDADASEKHGQHVAATFHLADFFVDNTVNRWSDKERTRPNQDWEVGENLSRLIKMVTHSDLIRPTIAETAMHHAHSARLRSACLSRQVGAAMVDGQGNIVATGTNEVPRAGGGVYGESFDAEKKRHVVPCSRTSPSGTVVTLVSKTRSSVL